MKKEIIHFFDLFKELEKNQKKIIDKVSSSLSNINDAVTIQQLKEKDFYPKHDYKTIIALAEKYRIDTSNFINIFKEFNKEKEILLKKMESLTFLKNISISGKSIRAKSKEGLNIEIREENKNLKIIIYPDDHEKGYTKEFYKKEKELKSLLEKAIN